MHAVFDHNAGGVLVVDVQGIIKSTNFMTEQIFGYSADELRNKHVNFLFPTDDKSDIWGGIVSKFVTMSNTCIFEGSAIRKDGDIFSLEIVLAKIEETQYGKFYVCTLRDNSRKELSDKIDYLVNSVLRRVLRGEETEEFSNYICDKIIQIFDFSLVWIGLKNTDGTIKVISATGHNKELILQQSNIMRWDRSDGNPIPAQQVIKSMETLIINVAPEDKEKDFFSQIVTIPLLFQNKVLGVIELHLEYGKLDEKILNRFETLALRLTMAIQIAKDQRYMRLLGTALETSANAVMITNPDGIIEWTNPAFTKITGYANDEAVGKPLDILKSGYHSDDFYKTIQNEAMSGVIWTGEVVERHKLGALFTVNQTITPIKNNVDEIIYFVISQEDLTARKVAESRIKKLANYDQLTGLPNRKSFTRLMERSIQSAEASGTKAAIMFISLVNFNRINETLGYNNSDKIIKVIAERIETILKKDDILARVSVSEFAAIIHNVSDIDSVSIIARKIINKIFNVIDIDNDEINIPACIGISIYPDDSNDVIKLANYADIAMHKAIKTIPNSHFFFSPEINSEAEDRIALERDIKKAVEKNEFLLYYQPQIDLESKRLAGFEALIRWQHPERGMVSPAKFIPIAEDTGIIVQIGNWVFKEALTQWKKWSDMGLFPDTIAVNVSTVQFQDEGLVETIENLLRETGVEPNCLEVEVTETMIMQDARKTDTILSKLHDMGIQIAIDDFGTGYSSLSYLKKFPVDRLKIDQSFVKDLGFDIDSNEVSRAIINLGHTMGMEVVSEGVENEAQFNILREQGCDIVQGYLTGKPMPADEATEFMKEKYKN